MALCQATTRDGRSCPSYAIEGSTLCFMHTESAKRDDAQRRGGHGRHTRHGEAAAPAYLRTLEEMNAGLDYVWSEAVKMDNGIQRDRLMVSVIMAKHEVYKTTVAEDRMANLEQSLKVLKEAA